MKINSKFIREFNKLIIFPIMINLEILRIYFKLHKQRLLSPPLLTKY